MTSIPDRCPPAVLRVPPLVHYGWGSVVSAPSVVSRLGARVLICTDATLAALPEFASLRDALAAQGSTVTVYSEGKPELPLASVEEAVRVAADVAPQVIVGYGGGSSIDLAKVVALLTSYPAPISDYYGENAVPGPVLPVVAVPTTAGTGSEVTPVAVVTDSERAFKVGISSPWLVPAAAVVDPALTRGCPARVRAHSGADALAHALEALTAGRRQPEWAARDLPVFVGSQLLGDHLAADAAVVIGRSLHTAVDDPGDDSALASMAYGSLCAGMAFGTSGTHLGHALQYSIGAATQTSHGLGVGLLLPYVLEATRPVSDCRLVEVAQGWDLQGSDPAAAVIDETARILAAVGIPRTLADLGLGRDDLPALAQQSAGFSRLVDNAPVAADSGLLLRILRAAWTGDRSLVHEDGRS